jgi:chemotaxis protein MotA
VGLANIFFLPAAGKLKFKHRQAIIIKEMMLEGALGILEGQNPRVIEGKLSSFLEEKLQKEREQARERKMKAA